MPRNATAKPKPSPTRHQSEAWDTQQTARATHFSVAYRRRDGAFGGRGFTIHNNLPSIEAARELARHHAPAMLYAITPEGWTIPVESAIPDARPRFH